MKIKKFLIYLAIAAASVSCEKFDDSALWDAINKNAQEITLLKEQCSLMNTNIAALQGIVAALQSYDSVLNVAPIVKGGLTIGYTITFAKGESVTIFNADSSSTPAISAKEDGGVWFWTIDGEWMKDANGNRIKASGSEGQKGADGVTPQLKIEEGWWYVSYDKGANWTKLSKATTESGSSVFASVNLSNPDVVTFTLSDGTSFTLPRKQGSMLYNEALVGKWVFDSVELMFCGEVIATIVSAADLDYEYFPNKSFTLCPYLKFYENGTMIFSDYSVNGTTGVNPYVYDEENNRIYGLPLGGVELLSLTSERLSFVTKPFDVYLNDLYEQGYFRTNYDTYRGIDLYWFIRTDDWGWTTKADYSIHYEVDGNYFFVKTGVANGETLYYDQCNLYYRKVK